MSLGSQGRGGGGARPWPGSGEQTRSWLGPGSSIIQRGRGPSQATVLHPAHTTPCTQHYYQNIDLNTLKQDEYHPCLSHTRRVVTSHASHLARARPHHCVSETRLCQAETDPGKLRNWESVFSGLGPGPLACPVTNALRDRFLPISLLPHLISTIMCNFPNQISNHNAGTTKFLKYAWRWL